jgi:hypothetical protein
MVTNPYTIYKGIKSGSKLDNIPTTSKWDWMNPQTFKQSDEMDLLKTIYPHLDYNQIKLGAQPLKVPMYSTDVRTNLPRLHAGRQSTLPPSNYLDILEQVRLGTKSQLDAAKELGMTVSRSKERADQLTVGKPFENLWNAFIKKYPHPEELQAGLLSSARKNYELGNTGYKVIQPVVKRSALDLMKIADEGDPNVPYELRVFDAWKQKEGIPLGVGLKSAGKEGSWRSIQDAIQSLTGKPFGIKRGKLDTYTGRYYPEGSQKPPLEAFNLAKDGDILTYNARSHARDLDVGNQKKILVSSIKNNPKASDSLAWLKNQDPSSSYYDIDHVKATMFGGTGDITNLKAILKGAHKGSPLEPHMTASGNVSSFKSGLDHKAYALSTKIIDIFDSNNIKYNKLSMNEKKSLANKTSKQIETLANNFKKDHPDIDFIIGDPFVYVKNSKAEKGFDKMTYAEKILGSSNERATAEYYIKTHKNLPNKDLSLFDSVNKVKEQLIPFSDMFDGKLPTTKDKIPNMPRGESLGKWIGKEGGLVRPNMALGGDMAQYEQMESVVPDLNPDEAEMQLAMSFKNPFKLKKTPPLIDDVDTTLKIADRGPGTSKTATQTHTLDAGVGSDSIFYLKSDMELANAVQNKMSPQQWLGYLTKKGVSPTELNEFGLKNLLYNMGGWDESTKKWKNNTAISKSDLIAAYKNEKPIISYKIHQVEPFEKGVKDFTSFLTKRKSGGSYYHGETGMEDVRGLLNKPQDIAGDTLRLRLSETLKNVSDLKKDWPTSEKAIIADINKTFKQFYGIDDVIKNGIPEGMKIPFYSKNLLDRFNRLRKGEGFYFAKGKGVQHEGTQFMPGGTGYIEIPFTYNPNPKGKRANEPRFTYGEGHFTNPEGNNPVFWMRASERTDEQGNRILFIEEIQSDMHQKVKQRPDTFSYAPRQDSPGMVDLDVLRKRKTLLVDELTKVTDQIDKITGHTDPSAATILERLKVKRDAVRKELNKTNEQITSTDAFHGKKDESLFPEGPFKKSENQSKIAIKTAINLAQKEGFDGVAIVTGKAKNKFASASGETAKGNIGFYDQIAVKAMKSTAKNLDLDFSSTNIKDGQGNTWAKIPVINLKESTINTSVDMYKAEGGYIHRPSFVDVIPTL